MTEKIGPTGKYPNGKMHPGDNGELIIGISGIDDHVVIKFGIALEMIGMTPNQAIDIAYALIDIATKMKKKCQN